MDNTPVSGAVSVSGLTGPPVPEAEVAVSVAAGGDADDARREGEDFALVEGQELFVSKTKLTPLNWREPPDLFEFLRRQASDDDAVELSPHWLEFAKQYGRSALSIQHGLPMPADELKKLLELAARVPLSKLSEGGKALTPPRPDCLRTSVEEGRALQVVDESLVEVSKLLLSCDGGVFYTANASSNNPVFTNNALFPCSSSLSVKTIFELKDLISRKES